MGLLDKLFNSDDATDGDLEAVGDLVDDMIWDQRNKIGDNAVPPVDNEILD